MMKKVSMLLFLLMLSISAASQDRDFGKVTVAELSETAHPTDPSATAAILFKKGQVSFDYSDHDGFYMRTIVKTRIKIYNKDGYNWSNFELPYYLGHHAKEEVSISDAVTYNLVGGKIEKTKLKGDGEFDEKINKYWALKRITLPNVKEGSVIEYEYTIKSNNFVEMRAFDFQASIPTNYAEYKTYIPEYYKYNTLSRGYVTPKVTSLNQRRSIVISGKQRQLHGQTTFTTDSHDYMELQTTYSAENLPAMRDEAYVNNITNYTAGVTHELAMIRFPQSPTKMYSTDWMTVTKKIYEDDDFGAELNRTGYFEDVISPIVAQQLDDEQKIAAIFNHVKSTMTWNKYNGYSCEKGVRQAYKDKTGNAAEINLMLTAMLRYAGFNANPILLSTRSNGIALFPTRTAFNYVIAAVETPNGLLLFDATEKFSAANVLPLRDLNWFGRLIRKDGSSLQVDLIPETNSKTIATILMTPAADGSITGKIRMQYTDQEALAFRQTYANVSEEAYIESLENRNGNIEIIDYKRDNATDVSKVLTEMYDFTDTGSVELIGDRIYVSPLLFLSESENPFKQQERLYPVDFDYPQQRKFTVNIDIPEGYAVETLPQSLNIGMEGNRTSFRYNIAQAGNKIQLSIISDTNVAMFPAEFYVGLKDYYRQIVEKQNERIIFKKI